MNKSQNPSSGVERSTSGMMNVSVNRRNFLRNASLTTAAGIAILAVGCKKDDVATPSTTVDLGSGDVGILNYAYALEQLEAAFYTQVITTPYIGMAGSRRIGTTD